MKVTVKTPASSANLGPGFDTLGVALCLYNTVTIETIENGLEITCSGVGADKIPLDETNIVYTSALKVWEQVGYNPSGIKLHLHNEIPPARGLGSSSAAIVCGVTAANAVSGNMLGEREILQICMNIEGHADNIVPALVGGFCVATVVSNGHVEYIKVPPSKTISAVAIVPSFELKTSDARKVLPESFSFQDVVYNVGHSAFFVSAFITGNFSSLKFAMEDRLHQPYRESLIPGMRDVFSAAMQAGAQSVSISGSGPTLIAFVNSNQKQIGKAMQEAWQKHNIESQIYILSLDTEGHQIFID
ncbi:MAG: homoserine kinase [Armatimonadota bacterium]